MKSSINQIFEKFYCYVCPNFCVLRVRVCLNEVNRDWNSVLDSIDRRRDLPREHWDHSLVIQYSIKFLKGLIMYSCLKYLPTLQMYSWTKRMLTLRAETRP